MVNGFCPADRMSDTLSSQPLVSSGLSTTTADSDSETDLVAAGSTDSGPGPSEEEIQPII